MSFQAYLDNIEAKTGTTPEKFVAMAKKKKLTTFKPIIDWLKTDFGLGLGHARAIAHVILHGPKISAKQTTGRHKDATNVLLLAGTKTKIPSTVIKAYMQPFPKHVQKILMEVYKAIKDVAPMTEETIGYGMPTFKMNGKNLVHFAAWKDHVGLYPTPTPISAFKKELARFEVSKGAVKFPLDKPMPSALIKKLVQYRVKQLAGAREKSN